MGAILANRQLQAGEPDGFVIPIVVANQSHATAAQVTVRGWLRSAGHAEERTAQFANVSGRREAKGGLVSQANPAAAQMTYNIDGFASP